MLLQNSNTWASGSEIKETYEYAEKVYEINKAYTDATGRKRYAYIQTYVHCPKDSAGIRMSVYMHSVSCRLHQCILY